MLSSEYEPEQAALEVSIEKAEAELEAFNADTERADQFIALARKREYNRRYAEKKRRELKEEQEQQKQREQGIV